MRDHRAVISGSFALQFFERTCWKESDLDLFVQKPSEAKALEEHLVRTEGYRRREASDDATQYHFGTVSDSESRLGATLLICGVGQVRTYVRDTQVIQLVCGRSRRRPVQSILVGFYGSAIMNVITWNRAYCLFPHTTFVERGMCALRTYLRKSEKEAMVKYSQRGWPVLDWSPLPELQAARRVGDSMTWVIPFETCPVGEVPAEDKEVECVRFAVGEHCVVLLKR
jgi:hypothetical protein